MPRRDDPLGLLGPSRPAKAPAPSDDPFGLLANDSVAASEDAGLPRHVPVVVTAPERTPARRRGIVDALESAVTAGPHIPSPGELGERAGSWVRSKLGGKEPERYRNNVIERGAPPPVDPHVTTIHAKAPGAVEQFVSRMGLIRPSIEKVITDSEAGVDTGATKGGVYTPEREQQIRGRLETEMRDPTTSAARKAELLRFAGQWGKQLSESKALRKENPAMVALEVATFGAFRNPRMRDIEHASKEDVKSGRAVYPEESEALGVNPERAELTPGRTAGQHAGELAGILLPFGYAERAGLAGVRGIAGALERVAGGAEAGNVVARAGRSVARGVDWVGKPIEASTDIGGRAEFAAKHALSGQAGSAVLAAAEGWNEDMSPREIAEQLAAGIVPMTAIGIGFGSIHELAGAIRNKGGARNILGTGPAHEVVDGIRKAADVRRSDMGQTPLSDKTPEGQLHDIGTLLHEVLKQKKEARESYPDDVARALAEREAAYEPADADWWERAVPEEPRPSPIVVPERYGGARESRVTPDTPLRSARDVAFERAGYEPPAEPTGTGDMAESGFYEKPATGVVLPRGEAGKINTVDAVAQAREMVGDAEFERIATEAIARRGTDDPLAQAAAVEEAARSIVAGPEQLVDQFDMSKNMERLEREEAERVETQRRLDEAAAIRPEVKQGPLTVRQTMARAIRDPRARRAAAAAGAAGAVALTANDEDNKDDPLGLVAAGTLALASGGREAKGFYSRLGKHIESLPKQWDSPRTAAEWMQKLGSGGAFSKTELEFTLKPELERVSREAKEGRYELVAPREGVLERGDAAKAEEWRRGNPASIARGEMSVRAMTGKLTRTEVLQLLDNAKIEIEPQRLTEGGRDLTVGDEPAPSRSEAGESEQALLDDYNERVEQAQADHTRAEDSLTEARSELENAWPARNNTLHQALERADYGYGDGSLDRDKIIDAFRDAAYERVDGATQPEWSDSHIYTDAKGPGGEEGYSAIGDDGVLRWAPTRMELLGELAQRESAASLGNMDELFDSSMYHIEFDAEGEEWVVTHDDYRGEWREQERGDAVEAFVSEHYNGDRALEAAMEDFDSALGTYMDENVRYAEVESETYNLREELSFEEWARENDHDLDEIRAQDAAEVDALNRSRDDLVDYDEEFYELDEDDRNTVRRGIERGAIGTMIPINAMHGPGVPTENAFVYDADQPHIPFPREGTPRLAVDPAQLPLGEWAPEARAQARRREPVVLKGEGATKFSTYQRVPGGRNYREILLGLSLPHSDDSFTGGHWTSVRPNVVAHLRLSEHTYRPGSEPTMDELAVITKRDKLGAEQGAIARAYNTRTVGMTEDQIRADPDLNEMAQEYASINARVEEVQNEYDRVMERVNAKPSDEIVTNAFEHQSDWKQRGEAEGYKRPPEAAEDIARVEQLRVERAKLADLESREHSAYREWINFDGNTDRARNDELERVYDDLKREHIAQERVIEDITGDMQSDDAVPDMPFKEPDQAFALTSAKMLEEAALSDSDRVAWSTSDNRVRLAGLSAEAAKITYDQSVKSATVKLLKGLGFNVTPEKINFGGFDHWSVKLTPEMKEKIKSVGFPMLSLFATVQLMKQSNKDGPERDEENEVAQASFGLIAAAIAGGAWKVRPKFKIANPEQMLTPSRDRLMQAAVSDSRGRVFVGEMHPYAHIYAARGVKNYNPDKMVEGFVVLRSKKFVDRREAEKVLDRAMRAVGSSYPSFGGVKTEDMKNAETTLARKRRARETRMYSNPLGPVVEEAFRAVAGGIDFTGSLAKAARKQKRGLSSIVNRVFDEMANSHGPIERLGAKSALRPSENPRQLLSYVKTSDATVRRALREGVIDPVTREVVGPSYESVFEPLGNDPVKIERGLTYVVAKRNVFRGLDAVGGDQTKFDQMKEVVAHGDADPIYTEFAKRWKDYVAAIGNYAVGTGLWTPQMWKAMEASDALYVKFDRIMEESVAARGHGHAGGKTLGNVTSGVKKFIGSRRAISNPAEAMGDYTRQVIHRADRYRIGAAVMGAIDDIDGGELIGTRIPDPNAGVKAAVVSATKAGAPNLPPDVVSEIERLFDPKLDKRNPVLWRNAPDGGREHMVIHAPELWRSVMQLNATDESAVRKFLDVTIRPLKRIFTATTTGWSPRFSIATNPGRDIPVAFAQTQAGVTAKDIAVGYAHGILSLAGKSKLADEAARFGLTGVSNFAQDRPAATARRVAPISRGDRVRNRAGKVVSAPVRVLEAAGSASDLGPRLGEYMAAMRQNMKKVNSGEWTIEDARLDAATKGRGITLDFTNRPGNPVLKLFADYIPFFGVGLNAPTKFAITAMENPGRVAAVSSAVAAAAVMAWVMKHRAGEEMIDRINDRDPVERSGFLYVPTSKNGPILRVPLSQELGIVANGVTAALDKLYEDDPSAGRLLLETLFRTIPSGMDAALQGVIPIPGVQQIQENARNRKVFGDRPVESRRLEDLPPSERRYPTTSPTFDALAAGARKLGIEEATPLGAENIVRGVASQATPFITSATDPIASKIMGRGANKPVPRGIAKSPINPMSTVIASEPPPATATEQRYYDLKDRMTEAGAFKRDIIKGGRGRDTAEVNRFKRAYGDVAGKGLAGYVSGVDGMLRASRDREMKVRTQFEKGKISGETARTRLDALVTERQKRLRFAVRRIERELKRKSK